MLKKAIEASLQRFIGTAVVESFPHDMVMEAVVHAGSGGFGDLLPLEDDPGYARGGHKICPVVRVGLRRAELRLDV